ncbi:unnamed protein product [Malus baccata var. baccata]
MSQPSGYIDKTHPDYVCKLQRSLYGLKQAPRAWNERFTKFLLSLRFKSSYANPSLFVRHDGYSIVILLLYVDDIILTGDNSDEIQCVISQLTTKFDMKDLGILHFFSGTTDKFMHSPLESHFVAVKRILRYLKGTLDWGICFRPGSLSLKAYTDADWVGDPNDRRSTTGVVIFLGNNPVSWSSKKQHTVSRSSTEVEYRTMATTIAGLVWLQQLLKDLHIDTSLPPLLHCDNISAMSLATNPVLHSKAKHREIDCHFMRERVQQGTISLQFVASVDQYADILTKGVRVRQKNYQEISNLTTQLHAEWSDELRRMWSLGRV